MRGPSHSTKPPISRFAAIIFTKMRSWDCQTDWSFERAPDMNPFNWIWEPLENDQCNGQPPKWNVNCTQMTILSDALISFLLSFRAKNWQSFCEENEKEVNRAVRQRCQSCVRVWTNEFDIEQYVISRNMKICYFNFASQKRMLVKWLLWICQWPNISWITYILVDQTNQHIDITKK